MPRRKKNRGNCRICASDRHCQYHQKYDMMELQEKVYKKHTEGYSMSQIAYAFGLSHQTVKRYVHHVRKGAGGIVADDIIWDDGTTLDTDLS